MKEWKRLALVLAVGLGVFTVALPSSVGAIDVFEGCEDNTDTAVCESAGEGSGEADDAVDMTQIVINTALFVLGMVSVIMIIVGGIRYTTSHGDSSQVASAKNTILYAVIGLVIALLAYSIVNFVIDIF